jgi:hypothetical protein
VNPLDATEENLRRSRLLSAAGQVAGSLANEDIPGWNTPDEVQEWVGSIRRSDDDLPPHGS